MTAAGVAALDDVVSATTVPGSELYVMRCGWLACGEVPISSGIASQDTLMSLFLDAFLLACIVSEALPVGSQLGNRIISSGSTVGSSASVCGESGGGGACGGGARGNSRAATAAFHDEDISGDELERRTG